MNTQQPTRALGSRWGPQVGRTGRELWRLLTHFDPSAVRVAMALRNTLGVLLPLAIGVAVGQPRPGLAAAGGALAASFSDGLDAYPQRARRMLAASAVIALAMTAGVLSGRNDWIAVAVAAAAAFAAGMAIAVSQTAADIATLSLVWLVIYAGQALPIDRAFAVGTLALAGALLQTGLSLALWPFRPHGPERRALGQLFLELAGRARAPVHPGEVPSAGVTSTRAQEVLQALRQDYSVAGERYRAIVSQAERIQLALLALDDLHQRIAPKREAQEADETLRRFLHGSGNVLEALGQLLLTGSTPPAVHTELVQLDAVRADWHRRPAGSAPSFLNAVLEDVRFQMDAMAGQMRAALDLATGTTPQGSKAFAQREARRPWHLRLSSVWATLRANLNVRSVACRHALRLSLCVVLGDALGRAMGWHRSYWIPMTIAFVLKPDFSATFSRGLLRIAGELGGLLLATALFHWLPATGLAQVALIAVFMLLTRAIGPANFGALTLFVSALVVLLIAFLGETPRDVIVERGRAVAVGGALALAAYAVWPTWETQRVRDQLASLLTVYRDYFTAVAGRYLGPNRDELAAEAVEANRRGARLARSNLELSVQRWAAEPGTAAGDIDLLRGVMTSSLRFLYAVMTLEAGQATSASAPPRSEFRRFAADVAASLTALVRAVQGTAVSPRKLPDLREDVRLLVLVGDPQVDRYALVNVEADRIANSVNTLARQVYHFKAPRIPAR